MNDFLNSLKADLLDRRRLPIVVGLAVCLLAALAYAALSGGGSSAPSASVASSSAIAPVGAQGIAVSTTPASAATQAVAETTSGASKQSKGQTRNPFAPLPGSQSTTTAATTTPAPASGTPSGGGSSSTSPTTPTEPSSGSGGSGGSQAGPSGSGEASPQPAKKPATPKKEATVYRVAAAFGTAPAGTPPLSAQLTPFPNLKRQQPLPSSAQPLIVFRGVTVGGKSATFTLVGEAILRGVASCLPSASQCQAIELKPGQSEELEYIPLGGTAVTYQLHLVSIEAVKTTAAAARRVFRRESKSGLRLLRREELQALPGMRYSRSKGVLVLTTPRASAAVAGVRASGWGIPPGL